MPATDFGPLLAPRSIAVIGASTTSVAPANRFIRHLRAFGFGGRIVPIHPSAASVEDLPALRSVAELDDPVDYAYVAVAADRVPPLLRGFDGRVRFAQVISSGFGEVDGGDALERALVEAARDGRVRVVGPNCLGVHAPGARVTFTERVCDEAGPVAVVCQSGGLGIDVVRRGQERGLRFSALVTVGNCADVRPSELVEHFLAADDTAVVGLYLEGGRDARRLFEVLRAARCRKPVVILKGGRTEAGRRAAASHTGALASAGEGWRALSRQTGAVLVGHLDEFVDALLAFQCLPPAPRAARRVVLFGNGGGTSVLGTDALVEAGLEVPRLGDETLAALEALRLPAGSSVANPIDVPASALAKDGGRFVERILRIVRADGGVDVLLAHVNLTAVLGYRDVDLLGLLMDAALRVRAESAGALRVVLALRSDGDPQAEALRRTCRARAVAAGIPVFDELVGAARALACVAAVDRFREEDEERH